jgi:hypothetical protein
MQADSLHRRETARSDGRQDCFASADYGTHRDAAAGVARRKPDGSFKGECEVEVLGVVETAQASSAVKGLNRQRRQARRSEVRWNCKRKRAGKPRRKA